MTQLMAWAGGVGALVGILCCVTPVLPIALTAIGAASLIDVLYHDAVLLPFAGASLVMMGAGLWLIRKSS